MYKLILIYNQPRDPELFEAHYFAKHVPLLMQLPHLLACNIQRVTDTQNAEQSAYLVTELTYADENSFSLSYTSVEGMAVRQDGIDLLPYLHRLPVVHVLQSIVSDSQPYRADVRPETGLPVNRAEITALPIA